MNNPQPESARIEPVKLDCWEAEIRTLNRHLHDIAAARGSLEILEAGCGTRWGLDLAGVQYRLTGLDIDEEALKVRKEVLKDLDRIILGDLRTAQLEPGAYDLIFNANVLEHVRGARRVLDNFLRWVKPGGFIILLLPNGESGKALFTRITPHWFHVLYMRHVRGMANAGKPGFGPYPTFFDPEVSLEGIRRFCAENSLKIHAVYSSGHGRRGNPLLVAVSNVAVWLVHILSLGRITARHPDLIFIIEKPE